MKAKEERCESPVAVGECRCKYLFDQLKILITGLKGLTFFLAQRRNLFQQNKQVAFVGRCLLIWLIKRAIISHDLEDL